MEEQTNRRPEVFSIRSSSALKGGSKADTEEDLLPGPSHFHVEELTVRSFRPNSTPSTLPMGGRASHLIGGFGQLSPFL